LRAPHRLTETALQSWFWRLRYSGNDTCFQLVATETAMSASKQKPSHPSQEDSLDEALEETFPASDPIAIDPSRTGSQPKSQPTDDAHKRHEAHEKHRHGKH
jgi:hypothetical protein